jgi:hypothetical protein
MLPELPRVPAMLAGSGGTPRQQMGRRGPTPSTGPEHAETFAPASDTIRDFTTKAIPNIAPRGKPVSVAASERSH